MDEESSPRLTFDEVLRLLEAIEADRRSGQISGQQADRETSELIARVCD